MSPTDKPSVKRSAEPAVVRWLRVLLAIGPALILTFLAGLALAALSAPVRSALLQFFGMNFEGLSPATAIMIIMFFVLGPLILLGVLAPLRALTWRTILAGWAIGLLALAWLRWDDSAVRRPLTMEELVPAFAGAEKSYAVLMRYSTQHPSAEALEYARHQWIIAMPPTVAKEAGPWREFLTKNRKELETQWRALRPQRAWLDELNAFDRLGDLTELGYHADYLRLQVLRVLSQRSCTIASLQAMDGHGAEAVATLLPMLEVSNKLEHSARTLVRVMISVVARHLAYDTASFVLDTTPVPAPERARLLAALAGDNAPARARRIILMEYASFLPVERSATLGEKYALTAEFTESHQLYWRYPLDLVDKAVVNPVATTNLFADYAFDQATLAESRQLDKFKVANAAAKARHWSGFSIKNVFGRLRLDTASFENMLKVFWQVEDLRAALETRLKALPP